MKIKKCVSMLIIGLALLAFFNTIVWAEAPEKLSTSTPGAEVSFGGVVWKVLEPSTGYLVMKDFDSTKAFDPNNTNYFNPSDPNNIAYYLNNDFLDKLYSEDLPLIQTHTWEIGSPGNESALTVDAKVSLLSYSDWRNYYPILGYTPSEFWLRTPYAAFPDRVYYAFTYGWESTKASSFSVAIRPALYLDPEILISGGNVLGGKFTLPQINDPNLESAIRNTLEIPTGEITEADMAGLTSLTAENIGIHDLTGLEYAVNLQQLMLGENQIRDISPLQDLVNLQELDLNYNQVEDIGPLVVNSSNGGLGTGDTVYLQGNAFELSPGSQDWLDFEELINNGVWVVHEMLIAFYDAVETDKINLAIEFATGDSTGCVTQNINLPTEGLSGTTISWTSSKPEIVSGDGIVDRPLFEDAAVTLTAVIFMGMVSDTKEFTITVKCGLLERIVQMARKYGLTLNSADFDVSYDLNLDGIIDLFDFIALAKGR